MQGPPCKRHFGRPCGEDKEGQTGHRESHTLDDPKGSEDFGIVSEVAVTGRVPQVDAVVLLNQRDAPWISMVVQEQRECEEPERPSALERSACERAQELQATFEEGQAETTRCSIKFSHWGQPLSPTNLQP